MQPTVFVLEIEDGQLRQLANSVGLHAPVRSQSYLMKASLGQKGPRLATFLIYLNTVPGLRERNTVLFSKSARLQVVAQQLSCTTILPSSRKQVELLLNLERSFNYGLVLHMLFAKSRLLSVSFAGCPRFLRTGTKVCQWGNWSRLSACSVACNG